MSTHKSLLPLRTFRMAALAARRKCNDFVAVAEKVNLNQKLVNLHRVHYSASNVCGTAARDLCTSALDSAVSALAFLAVALCGTILALLAALIFGAATIAAMAAEPFLKNQFPDPRGGLDLQLAAKRTAAPHPVSSAAVRDPLAKMGAL
jgi:hypothetical protein